MARIKCRYYLEPKCRLGLIYDEGHCTDVMGKRFRCRDFTPDRDDVINPSCANIRLPQSEFEGEYKSYELDDYELRVGRNRYIRNADIAFLEIDGKEIKFKYECGRLVVDWADRKTEPTISKMEQVDKDINVRSKDERSRQ